MESPQSPVRNRLVFYIPGYDPHPARRYRELYRSESAEQGRISGYHVSVSADPGRDPHAWTARFEGEAGTSRARIEVLPWADLVRDSMSGSILSTYLQLLRTAWIYISTGALWRLGRLRKGPLIAALYPVLLLLTELAAATGLAIVVSKGARLAMGGFWPLGVILGGAVFVATLLWFRRIDGKLFAYYLMQDYAFSAKDRGRVPPALGPRLARFRARIAEALRQDVDEVLVIGHSSGAHLAVHVLADILGEENNRLNRPALAFLSLGHVIPMISFLPEATKLRADLHHLAGSDALTWVDISAPGDGCCFALCDPVAVTGVAPALKRWPLVLSAAFSQTLSAARQAALKRRYFRLHFQYLCAFDQPGDYDYFQITSGPQTLAQRFAERSPSASRIETPLSPYRDMGPL